MIPVVKYNFKLDTKEDMIKFHIMVKCFELGNYPEQSALNVLVHLYLSNGIHSKDDNKTFIEYCIANKYRGSAQSVRNVLSMYTELGLLVKPKNNVRLFKDPLFGGLPLTSETFVINYLITNLKDAA